MIEGWRKIVDQAKDIYWLKRRNGGSENEALSAVLDHCYRDDTIEELRKDMQDAEDARDGKWSRPSKWARKRAAPSPS